MFKQMLTTGLARYQAVLRARPYTVQSVQTGLLLWIGDVLAQKVVERKEYDLKRAARMTTIGFILGPSIHAWYLVLERMFGSKQNLQTGLKKMVVDQFLFAPILLAVFLCVFATLEGKSFSDIKKKLDDNYVDLVIANWKLWPAVQTLNFSVIPVEYRVLFLQFIAIGWNTFLAWRVNRGSPETPIKKGK